MFKLVPLTAETGPETYSQFVNRLIDYYLRHTAA